MVAFSAPPTPPLSTYQAFLPAPALHTSFRTLPPVLSSLLASSVIMAAPLTSMPPLPPSNSMAPLCSMDTAPPPPANSGTWTYLQHLQNRHPLSCHHQLLSLLWQHPPPQSNFSPIIPSKPPPQSLTALLSNMHPCSHRPFPPGLLPLTPATSLPFPMSPLPRFAATRLTPFP